MANSPTYKPLQMPDLNQLPDPTKQLLGGYGGLTSPQALIKQQPQDDLLNPKLDKAWLPDVAGARKQAAELAQQSQKEEEMIAKASDEAIAAQQRREEAAQKEASKRIADDIRESRKRIADYEKEQAKKEKEDKKKGIKRGLGADGSFILEGAVNKMLASNEWNAVVSNMERDYNAEQKIKEWEQSLAASGADAEKLANEVQHAKRLFKAANDQYAKEMKSDHIDPIDIFVTANAKAAKNTERGIAAITGASAEYMKDAAEDIEDIEDFYSKTMKLDKANYDFLRRKRKAENPNEGVLGSFGGAIADTWNADNVVTTLVDTAMYIPQAAVGGAKTAWLATKSGFARLGAALLGRKVSEKAVASAVGATVAGATLAATDAAGGAYDAVDAQNFHDPKQLQQVKANYDHKNGAGAFDAVVQENGGDLDKAKHQMAVSSARTAGMSAALWAAPLSLFGVEHTVTRMMTGAMGKTSVAKAVAGTAANTLSEALEEGSTQWSQNLGAQPVTSTDLAEGVGEAAALGAIMGGAMGGGSHVANAVASSAAQQDGINPDTIDPSKFTQNGTLDLARYQQAVGTQFAVINNQVLAQDDSAEGQAKAQLLRQSLYDEILDDPAKWAAMTPDQQTAFKEWVKQGYGINTNNYAQYNQSEVEAAYRNDNLEELKALAQTNPGAVDLLNAYRVKHGVELDQVEKEQKPYYEYLAALTDYLGQQPTDENTDMRRFRAKMYAASKIAPEKTLTADQLYRMNAVVARYLDAGGRRLTDAEVAAQQQTGEEGGTTNQQAPQNPSPAPGGQPVQPAPVPGGSGQGVGQGAGTGTAGTGQAGTGTQAVGQPAAPTPGGTDTQSIGDNNVQQAAAAGAQTNVAAQTGADVGGAGVQAAGAGAVGQQANTAAPATNGGQTAGTGVAGTSGQAGQPAGQTNPAAAPGAGSSGGVGTQTTEQHSANGGQASASQAGNNVVDLRQLGVPANSIPFTSRVLTDGLQVITRQGVSELVIIGGRLGGSGRPVIVLDVGGLKLPFYRSTGLGGKKDVAAGKWYPIFGIGSDSWFNKTSGSTGINDYYGVPALRQAAEYLDKTITQAHLEQADAGGAVPSTPRFSSQTYDFINQAFPTRPTDNHTRDTLKIVQDNIAWVKEQLAGVEFSPLNQGEVASPQQATQPGTQPGTQTATTTAPMSPVALVPGVTQEQADEAYNSLRKGQKAALKAVGITDAAALREVLAGSEDALTARMNSIGRRAKPMTLTAAREAVHNARDFLYSAKNLFTRLAQENRANSSNRDQIDSIATALDELTRTRDPSDKKGAMLLPRVTVRNLAKLAERIYGNEVQVTGGAVSAQAIGAARLLADVAGIEPGLRALFIKLKLQDAAIAEGKPYNVAFTDEDAKKAGTIDRVLGVLAEQGRIPAREELEERPEQTALQQDVNRLMDAFERLDDETMKALRSVAQKLTGGSSRREIAAALMMLRAGEQAGTDTARVLVRRLGGTKAADTAIKMLGALRKLEHTEQDPGYAAWLEAVQYFSRTSPEQYQAQVAAVLQRMYSDPNSFFAKNAGSIFNTTKKSALGESIEVITSQKDGKGVKYINLNPASKLLAQTIHDIGLFGAQYAQEIVRERGGVNEETFRKNVSRTSADSAVRLAFLVREQLVQERLNGGQQETAQEARTDESAATPTDDTTQAENAAAGETTADTAPVYRQAARHPQRTRQSRTRTNARVAFDALFNDAAFTAELQRAHRLRPGRRRPRPRRRAPSARALRQEGRPHGIP